MADDIDLTIEDILGDAFDEEDLSDVGTAAADEHKIEDKKTHKELRADLEQQDKKDDSVEELTEEDIENQNGSVSDMEAVPREVEPEGEGPKDITDFLSDEVSSTVSQEDKTPQAEKDSDSFTVEEVTEAPAGVEISESDQETEPLEFYCQKCGKEIYEDIEICKECQDNNQTEIDEISANPDSKKAITTPKPESQPEASQAKELPPTPQNAEKKKPVSKLLDESVVPQQPQVVLPDEQDRSKTSDEDTAEALAGRLEMYNKSCRDLFMDLRTFDFFADDEEMHLKSQDLQYFDRPLYFKMDPENPRDPKIQHAQKQYCKFVGVPYAFFMNNRPALRNQIVKTWQSGLDADDSKARCIARIRESQDYCVIRALLPEAHNRLTNSELMQLVEECSRSTNTPFVLEFSSGDNRDDLILHARFLFLDTFEVCKDKVRLGFSVTASELGAGPLTVDTLLHHVESKTAYVASYGSESFFSSKYEGIQAHEIKDMLPGMIERLKGEGPEMKERIESEFRQVEPHEECIKINTWGGIPRKFKRALFHEASAQEDDMRTSWDFARHISLIAKDFDAKKRLIIEQTAGHYLNLAFGKD